MIKAFGNLLFTFENSQTNYQKTRSNMKSLNSLLTIALITGLLLPTSLYAEDLIGLPRTEGSKNFDMEINNLIIWASSTIHLMNLVKRMKT